MPVKTNDYNYIKWLIPVSLILFLVNLQTLPVTIMEARNWISAREILQNDQWLLTTLNGEPRYQKPPLPTWLTAIAAAIFGMKNTWFLRLPAAFTGIVLTGVSYRFAKKISLSKQFAFLAALILSSSLYVVISARENQWDIYTHSFMMCSIYFLFRFFTTSARLYRNAVLAGIFLGFSFMSKGPVSLYALFLPFLLAFGIVYKFYNLRIRIKPLLLFSGISIAVSFWWYGYIIFADPDAFTTVKKETANWSSYETRPFYYYWNFVIQSGIWTIPAGISLVYFYLKNKVFNKKIYRFTLLWTVFSVILLSLVPEKKSRYLLPVLIPLAFNTAFYIEYLFRKFRTIKNKSEVFPVYFNFGLLGCTGLVFPVAGYFFLKTIQHDSWNWFFLLSISLFSIGAAMIWFLYKKKIRPVFYLTIGFCMAIICFGLPLEPVFNTNPDYYPMSDLKTIESEQDLRVYEFRTYDPQLYWDYGGTKEVLSKGGTIRHPAEDRSGILVSPLDTEDFFTEFDSCHISPIQEFDMNQNPENSSKHRMRLKRTLYLLQKK